MSRTHSTATRHESFSGSGDVGNITLSGVSQEVGKGCMGSALVERDDIGLPVGTQTQSGRPTISFSSQDTFCEGVCGLTIVYPSLDRNTADEGGSSIRELAESFSLFDGRAHLVVALRASRQSRSSWSLALCFLCNTSSFD